MDLMAPQTKLPIDPAVERLSAGEPPAEVASAYPTSCAAWAVLAEEALGEGALVMAYAYARTGYHRGLDALRKAGWRGTGPVPWDHQPNQGFLRALNVLRKTAHAIGETDEEQRCADLLDDCDRTARSHLD